MTKPLSWFPVAVGWPGHREQLVHDLHAGLVGAGIEVRIETLGTPPFDLTLLRVQSPCSSLEDSENWMLQLLEPWDEQDVEWASNLDGILRQRWPEFHLWRGTSPAWRRIYKRPPLRRRRHSRAFTGYSLSGFPGPHDLAAFARSAIDIVRFLPSVRIHGVHEHEDPHSWVALSAGEWRDPQEQLAVALGLESLGFRTALYRLGSVAERRGLLAVHAGQDDLEQLIQRIAEATRDIDTEWASRAVWRARSLIPQIAVHRFSASGWESTCKRFAAALRDVPFSSWSLGDSAVITAPLNEIDRVLAVADQLA